MARYIFFDKLHTDFLLSQKLYTDLRQMITTSHKCIKYLFFFYKHKK